MDQQGPGIIQRSICVQGTSQLGLNARLVDFRSECHPETHMAGWVSSSVVPCVGSSPHGHSAAVEGPQHPSSHLLP